MLSRTAASLYWIGRYMERAEFTTRLVDATISYAGSSVIIDGPSAHIVTSRFETFVFTDGTVNNADGDPLVDDLFYYSRNPDVWNAHADADAHYHASGWHEGRDPNGFFSSSWYLSLNSDVGQSGAGQLDHYHQSGWREGRDPSVNFDTTDYLSHYPDVAAAHVDPLFHYLQSGIHEGRSTFADGVWG